VPTSNATRTARAEAGGEAVERRRSRDLRQKISATACRIVSATASITSMPAPVTPSSSDTEKPRGRP
jgi:hypothetical protein